jgi:hypothetical protein
MSNRSRSSSAVGVVELVSHDELLEIGGRYASMVGAQDGDFALVA